MRDRGSKLPGPKGGPEREEQVREIMELRRALARTRQDLQRSRGRGASSSDEEPCRREELSGSLSGSLNGLSNKPCLNRELVAKLRSMTETIKMLSTENVALREENDGLVMMRATNSDVDNNEVSDTKLTAVIQSYEKQMEEMSLKISSLEAALLESREKAAAAPTGQGERDKYKGLARRLKEERNQFKEMLEAKNNEQAELQVEMDKMTEMIGELRENCNVLQQDLLSARQDDTRRQDASVQTSSTSMSGIPPVRRASLTELSPRARLSPKRTISNISQSSLSSNSSSPRSASQLQKSIELSRPKQRSASMSSCSSSPAKGARIAKPVARQHVVPNSPRTGGSRSSSINGGSSPRSPLTSPAPTRTTSALSTNTATNNNNMNNISSSKTGSPIRSRLPLPTGGGAPARSSSIQPAAERRDVLHIDEEEEKEDQMSQSDSSSLLAEAQAVSRIVTVQLERVLSRETSPTMETGEVPVAAEEEEGDERKEEEDDFPAPPSLGDLEELAREQEVPATPRTLRRADSLRQKMAARRIQRTWKHFYQELEEKKAHTDTRVDADLVEEEQEREDAISDIQAVIMGHQGRAASLAAARARGGIFTARPWVAGGALSEGDESEEENVEKLQGIIRSHSFRLRTLHEEDVFSVGKVSSIRAKFSRRSPDGASDDYLVDSDRNV